jgi:hypothetical protein
MDDGPKIAIKLTTVPVAVPALNFVPFEREPSPSLQEPTIPPEDNFVQVCLKIMEKLKNHSASSLFMFPVFIDSFNNTGERG